MRYRPSDLELLALRDESPGRDPLEHGVVAAGNSLTDSVPQDRELDVSLVYLIEAPPSVTIDAAIVRSDVPHPERLRCCNPGGWHPREWIELLEGSLGPWTMVVDDRRVLSICHTPCPLTAQAAEAGVWTAPDVRGRGYAAAATVEWTAMLRPSGRQLFYATRLDNHSSQRVAQRLNARWLGWAWEVAAAAASRRSNVHPLSRVRETEEPVIERLGRGDGARWRSIRLRALQEAPHAFGTTFAEASAWPPERWEAQVLEFATFIAVAAGRDVGVARGAGHERSDVRELIGMWVDPAARRRRIGAQIIQAVATWAKHSGASVLVLDVVEGNAPAIALYERAGFVRFDGDAIGERAPGELRFVRSLATITE
jgi:RimJ/RimL family protein N-acetyltransferase